MRVPFQPDTDFRYPSRSLRPGQTVLSRDGEYHDTRAPGFSDALRFHLADSLGINTRDDIEQPLDANAVRQLIERVHMQMDHVFFNSFSEDGEDGCGERFPINWTAPVGIDRFAGGRVSKNRQLSYFQDRAPAGDYSSIIDSASRKFGVDADLIKAIVKVESDFDPIATSPKGAMGMMQLMPETARELGVDHPFDPYDNIMGGTRYLKRLIDRYNGDIPLALAAYNWGMGNLERHSEDMPEETRNYIKRVRHFYDDEKRQACAPEDPESKG